MPKKAPLATGILGETQRHPYKLLSLVDVGTFEAIKGAKYQVSSFETFGFVPREAWRKSQVESGISNLSGS